MGLNYRRQSQETRSIDVLMILTLRGTGLKIAIVGGGITGAYLYRLLKRRGQNVEIFDIKPATRCGISPCAWATTQEFNDLVASAGLHPSTYILTVSDYIIMDGIRMNARFMTIDKPRLIGDLLHDARLNHAQPLKEKFDRIIDATGSSRKILPPIEEDTVLQCVQFRIRTNTPRDNEVKLGNLGYAWRLPLSNNEYHIGCGSLVTDPMNVMKDIAWMQDIRDSAIVCGCKGMIRATGTDRSRPFFKVSDGHEVWGIGESIGCVGPLAGDGIIPGMKSVHLLLDHWNDPSGYTKAIMKEFGWMGPERDIIIKLRDQGSLRRADAWVLRKNARRMGMDVRLKDAATLLRHLR